MRTRRAPEILAPLLLLAATVLASFAPARAQAAATAVSVASDLPSPQPVGTVVTFSAAGVVPAGPYEYRFWLLRLGGVWAVVQPYGPAASWSWDTAGTSPGQFAVQVDVRTPGSTVTWEAAAAKLFTVAPLPATGVTLAASPASPQAPGAVIQWTAAAQGGAGSYEYRFWLRQAGGTWSVARDYSPAATWTWDTAGVAAGDYFVEVDARSTGSLSDREAAATRAFGLGTSRPTGVTLAPSPASPQAPGATIVFTASNVLPVPDAGGLYEYRFWLRTAGLWQVVQPFSGNPVWNWATTAATPAGQHYVQVDVRLLGSASAREAWAAVPFFLGPATTPATGVSLAPSAPSPQPAGTRVVFGAAGAGGTGSYEYRFWLLRSGGVWSEVQGYSAASAWTFDTTGLAGRYYVEVDVRSAGSPALREAARVLAFDVEPALAPGKAVTLAGLPGSTFGAGVDLNNLGLIAGLSESGVSVRAVLWSATPGTAPSAPVELSSLGGSYSAAYGVNDLGAAVGEAEDAAGRVLAAYWAAGTTAPVALDTPPGPAWSSAYGVNGSGQIVGESMLGGTDPVAVLWNTPTAAALPLGTLGGRRSAAYAISGGGLVAGEAETASGARRAAYWRITRAGSLFDGPVDLGALPGHVASTALGANDAGEIAGHSEAPDGTVHAVAWLRDAGGVYTAIDLGGAPAQSGASDVNSAHRIVGWTAPAGAAEACVWGSRSPDPTASASLGVVPFSQAYGVNDLGQAVGIAGAEAFFSVP